LLLLLLLLELLEEALLLVKLLYLRVYLCEKDRKIDI
jgi:hypothetical protein